MTVITTFGGRTLGARREHYPVNWSRSKVAQSKKLIDLIKNFLSRVSNKNGKLSQQN